MFTLETVHTQLLSVGEPHKTHSIIPTSGHPGVPSALYQGRFGFSVLLNTDHSWAQILVDKENC